MIPAPPFDPALPATAALLDEPSVLAMLPVDIREAVTGCTPRYIRYKPGTSCLIQYDLALVTGETLSAQIRIFSDNRAERRASSSRLHDLRARAAGTGPDIERVAYLPGVNGLLQIFPVDYDMPSLARVANPGRMTKLLRAWLEASGDAAVTGGPETVRYKPARKAMLRYRLRNAPFDALYGKVLSSGHSHSLPAWTNTLIQGGVRTPPVAFLLPEHRFVAHAEVTGTQLAVLRGQPGYVDQMAPLAETLQCLQAVELDDLPVYRLADLAAEIAATSGWLGAIAPHLQYRYTRLSERLGVLLAGIDDRLVTTHGDFYDDQALVSGTGLTLIDMDELRLAHPLLDAGNILAHLSSGSVRDDEAPGAYDAFRTEVLRRLQGTESELAVFEAAALLKLAPGPFRRLEPDWPAGIAHILEVAERLLEPREAAKSARKVVVDPALPQLATLQDPERMAVCLGNALGDATVALRDVEVVRHKPGRRAILRYRLGNGERLYGKIFASARGPKVYEITNRITSARAFGADVALPGPVGYLPDLNMLLQREVEGEPVTDLLLGGDRDLGIRIAFALYQFHTSGLELGRVHDLAKELSPLPMRQDQVANACPDLRAQAIGCLRRIDAVDGASFTWRTRPVHRDFYHEQILLGREGLAILDLDDAAMSEPAVDVANFVAHLMLLGAQRRRDVSALASVSNGFIGQYCQLDAELDRRLLTYLTATTLLRLAGIHVTRPHGVTVARLLLDATAGLLDAFRSPAYEAC